jgi:replicative DNA helicase
LTHHAASTISRQQELNIISQELRRLAENLNIVVLITHELPEIKNYNSDEDVKPSLKELYNDTPVSKYADLVMFLYRPEFYGFNTWYHTDESTECEAELVIARNRQGNIHSFRLFFDGYRSRFNEVDDDRFKKQPWKANSEKK